MRVAVMLVRSRPVFVSTLILQSTILGSTILKPDLDLSVGEADLACNERFLVGRDVCVGDVLVLQLSLLPLVVHRPVFLPRSRLPCKSQHHVHLI